MTDEEVILRTIRMPGFGELSRTLDDGVEGWWCYVYEVTASGRKDRHAGNGDTAARACIRAVFSLERASGRREM